MSPKSEANDGAIGRQFQSLSNVLSARSAMSVPKFRILTSIERIILWFYFNFD